MLEAGKMGPLSTTASPNSSRASELGHGPIWRRWPGLMDHIFFFVLFLCSFFPGCLQCSEFVWAEDCPVHTGHSVNSALSVFGALSLCLLALHFFCFFPFRCLKRSLPSQKLKRCTFKAVSHFTHLPVIFNVQSSFSKSTLSTIFYHFHPFHFMTLCVHACERERGS